MSAKYTFLLPAYKAKFFAEALESIKSQTYSDFKVIVSDDCSPEDLKSIYDSVCGDDPRFSYRRNAENMGGKSLVSHWNLLVNMCETEYLVMASDDDVYEPNFLEEIEKLSILYPNVSLLRSAVRTVDVDGNELEKETIDHGFDNNLTFVESHFNENRLTCVANYVFKMKELKEIGGFYETPIAWYSDQITSILMSENGCANTDQILFNFRISDKNITGTKSSKRVAGLKAKATLIADEWLAGYIRKKNYQNIHYYRWGKMIYYWLMDSDFNTFFSLLPKIYSLNLWDNNWMPAIIRHQLKSLFIHNK